MSDTFTPLGDAAARVVRGLTERQKEARNGKLTASRVACLMNGDAAKIHRLWLEMTGQEQEENLSDVWPVQLGMVTEHLNLDWAERKLCEYVINRGIFIQHPDHDWAGATLDGVLHKTVRPIEAKHCGGREPIETIIDRYSAQMQWIMECAVWKPQECALSVIFGANEPVIEWIPRDDDYIAEMVRRGRQFMSHVRNRTPPVELPPVPPPVIPSRSYDMSESNSWSEHANTWLSTREYAVRCKTAETELKGMVSADAKEAFGRGVVIRRDRAGRLSLREQRS